MPPRYDPEAVAEAERLQESFPGWLVMWRPWRQCFTAFEGRDPDQVRILEAETTDELRRDMQLVEIELWQILPRPAADQPTPNLVGYLGLPDPTPRPREGLTLGRAHSGGSERTPGPRLHLVRPYVGR
ncbi:hypothetical protein [Streptosporangium sp. NPDC048865]|uniref:hypothetical protein n=1 Tax=Streptosporangium sp. NPDC048865 TaxID=3155766 RepID=UPI0034468DCA